jgi:hypothetical protein
MTFGVCQFARHVAALALLLLFVVSTTVSAQTHIVSPADLQKALVAQSQARQHSMESISNFLSLPQAQKVLGTAGIDASQLKTAISTLDDEELAQLAARSEKAQVDFAAGRLADRDLLLILIGIAALILIIVAVR